jgi:hypothetical protein
MLKLCFVCQCTSTDVPNASDTMSMKAAIFCDVWSAQFAYFKNARRTNGSTLGWSSNHRA